MLTEHGGQRRQHPYRHQRPPQFLRQSHYNRGPYSSYPSFTGYTSRFETMLWDQTKQLPKDAFKQVEQMYEQSNFPMEVRLHLAAFVESSFVPAAPDTKVDDQTATSLATQLLNQLDAKIAAMPNDPDKFLMKTKLQDMSDKLKVGPVSQILIICRMSYHQI